MGSLAAGTESERVRKSRAGGPGLLRRLPGVAYQRGQDLDGPLLFAAGACEAVTGYPAGELVAPHTSYRELVAPDDRDGLRTSIEGALEAGIPFEAEYRIIDARGEERWVWDIGHGVWDEDGELLAVEGYLTDITQRHEDAEQIAATKRMLEAVTDQTLVGIYVVREDEFLYVNEMFATIFGYEPEEILDRIAPLDLVAPLDVERVREHLMSRLQGEVDVLRYDLTGVRKDGSKVFVEVYGGGTEVDGRPAVAGVLVDNTDRKKLEEQIQQSQKLEAVGRLASGVAHDFNNLLTAVLGNTQLLLAGNLDEADRQSVLEIQETAERGEALTRQLLTFTRPASTDQPESIDLGEVVEGTLTLLARLMRDEVELVWELEEGVRVLANPGKLEQVIINLAVNARDAVPEGGTIDLTCRIAEDHSSRETGSGRVLPARHALLRVKDSGHGMSAEVRERIFDPFFTTKPPSQGTGLGLATVWGIVHQLGGCIDVESEPGVGTTFEVRFPLTDGPAGESMRSATEEPLVSPEGTETILLVDDDPAICSVAVRALERFGYAVHGANDFDGALEIIRDCEPDIVVSDVVLPTGSGPELVARLRQEGCDRPVLYISGYAEDQLAPHARRTGDGDRTGFLAKPFGVDELARAIRRLLAAETASESENSA